MLKKESGGHYCLPDLSSFNDNTKAPVIICQKRHFTSIIQKKELLSHEIF